MKRISFTATVLAMAGCATAQGMRRDAGPAEAVDDARFALKVAQAVARTAWPDWQPGSVPFVLVYPQEQWLFRATRLPTGYEPARVPTPLGDAYRARAWTRPDGVLVPFSPPRFLAQADRHDGHVVFTMAGASLAPFPRPDWATVFTHEYFHTFQMTDPRWRDDATALRQREPLNDLMRASAELRQGVEAELDVYREWLSRLTHGGGFDCARLAVLSPIRGDRERLLRTAGPGMVAASAALERFEGIARYVEESAYDSAVVLDLFRERVPQWQAPVAQDALRRRLAVVNGEFQYATGYALARLLDLCRPSWKQELRGRDLYDLAVAAPGSPP